MEGGRGGHCYIVNHLKIKHTHTYIYVCVCVCLRWFGHVQRRTINAPMKRSELIQVDGTKKRSGRQKIIIHRSGKKEHVN